MPASGRRFGYGILLDTLMPTQIDADLIIAGGGPAGCALAAACGRAGLRVIGLAADGPTAAWPNTYGIWEDELATLGFANLLAHRWAHCVSYADDRPIRHARVYGLLDNTRLQATLLAAGEAAGVVWLTDRAERADVEAAVTAVTTRNHGRLTARLFVDATGHGGRFVRIPTAPPPAYQAAYGVVGRFSAPPVEPGQLVLMDYRTDHLPPAERDGPPTFLYAMDLGNGRFFVEETSLAAAPAVPFDRLAYRLELRLAARGVQVATAEHVERVLFPMNPALPALDQPILAYGAAAGMVHPASGYQVGAALRRADAAARALAAALRNPTADSLTVARAGWQALWPAAELRKRDLYLFGLNNVLRMSDAQIKAFFAAFFALPDAQWSGYLSNTLSTAELLRTMWALFARAPWPVRTALASSLGRDGRLLWRAARGLP